MATKPPTDSNQSGAMAARRAPSPPPEAFELIAAANGVLEPARMDELIRFCDQQAVVASLSAGAGDGGGYRRSRVAWVKPDEGFGWLYERIGAVARGFNERFFGFELTGIEQALQVARYDASVSGGYDWHTDFGREEQFRKLSISVQLSPSDSYSGGDLEFEVSTGLTRAGRDRGHVIAFPSFVRHRVAPVTSGVRYSLVAWVHGPRWR